MGWRGRRFADRIRRMSGPHGQDPMVRWLAVPLPVMVDPGAVVVLPRRLLRANEIALGVSAGALDLQLGEDWIPATLYRWVRVRYGFWLGEVEIPYSSHNGRLRVPLRQWVRQEAVTLPPGVNDN